MHRNLQFKLRIFKFESRRNYGFVRAHYFVNSIDFIIYGLVLNFEFTCGVEFECLAGATTVRKYQPSPKITPLTRDNLNN